MRRLLVWLAVGALGAAVSGCGGTHCDDAATCEGGNETDREACEIQVESYYEQADVNGCTEFVDAWQDCMTAEDLCRGTRWGESCREAEVKLNNCLDGQGRAL